MNSTIGCRVIVKRSRIKVGCLVCKNSQGEKPYIYEKIKLRELVEHIAIV